MHCNNDIVEWVIPTDEIVVDSSSSENNQNIVRFFNLLGDEFLSQVVVNDNTAFGVLRTEESYRTLLRKLKAFGYSFAVRTSRTTKGKQSKMFHKVPGHLSFKISYSVCKSVRLNCTSGQTSKSCPAYMVMRQVNVYESGDPNSNSELQLWVSVSLPLVHNHALDDEPKSTRHLLDVDVKAMLLQITAGGSSTVDDVKAKLKTAIDKEFARMGIQPSPDNRAFFPSDKVINYHLRENGYRVRKANKLDLLRHEIEKKLQNIHEKTSKLEDKSTLKNINAWLNEFNEFEIE